MFAVETWDTVTSITHPKWGFLLHIRALALLVKVTSSGRADELRGTCKRRFSPPFSTPQATVAALSPNPSRLGQDFSL